MHFLFYCPALENGRGALYNKLQDLSNLQADIEKLNYLCNKPYIFANYLSKQWNNRMDLCN